MRCFAAFACALAASGSLCAEEFENRFKAAAKQVYELDEETRRSGLAEMVRLAEAGEARLPKLLSDIDLDTRSLVENFLRDLGYYFDPKATKRAWEILEALTEEPPSRQLFSRVVAVETPDPERRKLVEEFLALGKTSIVTLRRELAEFVTAPVEQPERIVALKDEVTCTPRLRNRGAAALWFLRESLLVRAAQHEIYFGQLISIFREVGQVKPAQRSDKDRIVDLLALMRRVKPGDEFDCGSVLIPTQKPGLALVTVTNFAQEKLIGTAFPFEASFGGESLSLELRYPEQLPTARYFVLAPTETPPWSCAAILEADSFALDVTLSAELGDEDARPDACWWIAEGKDGRVLGHDTFGTEELQDAKWTKPGTVRATLWREIPADSVRLWVGFKCGSDAVTRIARPIDLRAGK